MSVQHLTHAVHRSAYPAIDPSNPLNAANGRTVIISGGASGIGYAIAQGFSIAGASTIVLLARRQKALDEASARLRNENEAENRKTRIWTYLVDIRDSDVTDSVFEAIRKRMNDDDNEGAETRDADVLVTSAAQNIQGACSLDFGSQAYRDSFETNLVGNLNLVRAFLAPEMPAIPFTTLDGVVKDIRSAKTPTHPKVILDVSSSASYITVPGSTPYSASKLAFTRAMQHLQHDVDKLPNNPIRIHSFNPGVIFTPAAKSVLNVKVEYFEWDEESLPAGFAVWLASPAASFLKGRFVMSNWDVEELVAMRDRFVEDHEFCTITLKA